MNAARIEEAGKDAPHSLCGLAPSYLQHPYHLRRELETLRFEVPGNQTPDRLVGYKLRKISSIG